ncbi:MAG: glycosyltransferase family 4 protein, partial [Actinomycetales bacterium]|nr:glycosyltransferase family 4 protein [Actinomycetales bacterium]
VHRLNDFDLGVHVLPPVSFNNAWALPNKFFDFVQARLGVVVGPSPEMARLVREHGLGAVAEDFSAKALTAVLDALTPDRVTAWKQASHAAARELSAESQVQTWHRAVTALLT